MPEGYTIDPIGRVGRRGYLVKGPGLAPEGVRFYDHSIEAEKIEALQGLLNMAFEQGCRSSPTRPLRTEALT